jgi:hypothetical protein
MDKIKSSTARRVLLIFGLICVILAAIGLFLFFSLRTIERHNLELQTQVLREWTLSNDLSRNLRTQQATVFRHVQTDDDAEMKGLDQEYLDMK